MPFNLAAFLETQTATDLSPIDVVEDTIHRETLDDLFPIAGRESAIFGFLGQGVSTPRMFQIRQPSRLIPFDIMASVLHSEPDPIGGVTDLRFTPIPLFDEQINVYVQNATAEYSSAVLMLGNESPAGLGAFTHMLSGIWDGTMTVNIWNTETVTWLNTLPTGRYGVVGMYVDAYLAAGASPIACRLIFTDTPWRPGVPVAENTTDHTLHNAWSQAYQKFCRWKLMPELSFRHDNPPGIEYLSLTADTDVNVQLLLQRL